MIYKSKEFTYSDIEYPVIQYYGESCLNLTNEIREEIRDNIKKYLGKECITLEGFKGVIIGLEDNSYLKDYYYIVYVPELDRLMYVLANNPNFTETIK